MKLIKESTPIARKDYFCDATNFIIERSLDEEDLSPEEWGSIDRGREGIRKGEKYLCHTISDGGAIYTFRAIPEVHAIAIKYNIYDENA